MKDRLLHSPTQKMNNRFWPRPVTLAQLYSSDGDWDITGIMSDSKLFFGSRGDFGLREFRFILTRGYLASSESSTMSSSVKGIDRSGTFCFRLPLTTRLTARLLMTFSSRFEKVFRGLLSEMSTVNLNSISSILWVSFLSPTQKSSARKYLQNRFSVFVASINHGLLVQNRNTFDFEQCMVYGVSELITNKFCNHNSFIQWYLGTQPYVAGSEFGGTLYYVGRI